MMRCFSVHLGCSLNEWCPRSLPPQCATVVWQRDSVAVWCLLPLRTSA